MFNFNKEHFKILNRIQQYIKIINKKGLLFKYNIKPDLIGYINNN